MLPIAAEIAVRLTREQAQSALPDAPVVVDTPPAPPVRTPRRLRVARVLRSMADRYAVHWSDRAFEYGVSALLDAIEEAGNQR